MEAEKLNAKDRKGGRADVGYPRLQIPTFLRLSCRPSTKRGGIYLEKPGFPKSTLEKVGIWSGGYKDCKGLNSADGCEIHLAPHKPWNDLILL